MKWKRAGSLRAWRRVLVVWRLAVPRKWVLRVGMMAGLAWGAVAGAAVSRPNILFIVTDDQGPWAVGASGESQAVTPAMDRLAREGARFTQAFAPTPVCSPARASIMTGRYGSELGITDYLNPGVDVGLGLDPRVPSWPRHLQQAGYATALFGKWHLGDLEHQHPTRHGYGTFVGFIGGGMRPRDPDIEKDGVAVKREGFVVDLVTEEAMAWLEKHDRQRPFALSLHYREPHAPYLPVRDEDQAVVAGLDIRAPEPDFPGLDQALTRRTMREYLASVAALDRNLDRLLAALDRLDLARDTVVIFTSDHGYNIGHHGLLFKGNAQWRLLKKEALPPGTANVPAIQRPNMFDSSLKVPLLVRWPGVVRAGAVIDATVSHLDWFRTLLEIGGASMPREAVVHGRSIVPVLKGRAGAWDNDFYAEYSMKHGATAHLRMYRTTEWKLVRDFANPERDELYHLASDPGEKRNVLHDTRPEVRRVRAHLSEQIRLRMAAIADLVAYQPIADVVRGGRR